MSLVHVRYGIKAAIDAAEIPGLEVFAYRNPNVLGPSVHVDQENLRYVQSFGGADPSYSGDLWRIWILLPSADITWAQAELDKYLDVGTPESIPDALAAYPDLPFDGEPTVGDSKLLGFARVDRELQGPGQIDWMGPIFWGVPLQLWTISL